MDFFFEQTKMIYYKTTKQSPKHKVCLRDYQKYTELTVTQGTKQDNFSLCLNKLKG